MSNEEKENKSEENKNEKDNNSESNSNEIKSKKRVIPSVPIEERFLINEGKDEKNNPDKKSKE
jgi:hypothetical protein